MSKSSISYHVSAQKRREMDSFSPTSYVKLFGTENEYQLYDQFGIVCQRKISNRSTAVPGTNSSYSTLMPDYEPTENKKGDSYTTMAMLRSSASQIATADYSYTDHINPQNSRTGVVRLSGEYGLAEMIFSEFLTDENTIVPYEDILRDIENTQDLVAKEILLQALENNYSMRAGNEVTK